MIIKPVLPLSPDPCQVKEPEPIDIWIEEDSMVTIRDQDQLYRGIVNKITGPDTFSVTINYLLKSGKWVNVLSSYTWCTFDRIVKVEG